MRRFLSITVFLSVFVNAQRFSDYRARYDHFEENDDRAFLYLNPLIEKAKRERNYRELFQAYKDAVSFSYASKLDYADSLIAAASLTGDRDLIATAFLTKGTVYYFNYKKFQPALDEYLKAWTYSRDSEDEYLYYKNRYHLGIVKSYLGYYDEALEIFTKCSAFFDKHRVSQPSPNLRYNSKKGYLNVLHQKSVCLIELSRLAEAEQLVEKGLEESGAEVDFYLERSYFHKLKGIIGYHQKRDSSALFSLDNSLAGIKKKEDFANASIVYYYLGKSYERLDRQHEAIENFKKIYSIFIHQHFILPQVRESYEILINHYREDQDQQLELYYTSQLLKVDQILATDFKYLASKLHKEYDTRDLVASKRRLETSVSYLYLLSVVLGISLVALLLTVFRKKRRKVMLSLLSERLAIKSTNKNLQTKAEESVGEESIKNIKVSEGVTSVILLKLSVLEKNNFYLEKGMTLHKLAVKLNTNSTYLSMIIKNHKGCHFNAYLKQLRLQYVTKKLQDSAKWRHYSVETLSKECGFADRTNFSRAFKAYNSVSPVEFIQNLNDSLSDES